MTPEDKPQPLINQTTVDWLERVFPTALYKNGMLLEEIAYAAGQQSVILRMKRELRR